MRRRLRRLVPLLNFLVVPVLLGLLVLLAFETSDPLQRVEKDVLVTGRVEPAASLSRLAPLQSYVALHAGTGIEERLPTFPVDDLIAEPSGSFSVRADVTDGTQFFVFVRVEGADFSTYCARQPLPPVRHEGDRWVDAETGEPLRPLRVRVAASGRCTA